MCDVILSQAAPLLAAVSRFVRHSPDIQQGWDPDSRAPVRDSAWGLHVTTNAYHPLGHAHYSTPQNRWLLCQRIAITALFPLLTEAPDRRPGNDADRHRLPDAQLDDRLQGTRLKSLPLSNIA